MSLSHTKSHTTGSLANFESWEGSIHGTRRRHAHNIMDILCTCTNIHSYNVMSLVKYLEMVDAVVMVTQYNQRRSFHSLVE